MNRLKRFQRAYEESVAHINEASSRNDEYGEFVKWMLETESDPYIWLPRSYAVMMEDATRFSTLIGLIHHAFYDDGDIEMVKIDTMPRIFFDWRHEDGFRERCLSDTLCRDDVDLVVLDVSLKEFSELVDSYYLDKTKKAFVQDAARYGIEFAKKHYSSNYVFYDDSWVDTLAGRIEKTHNRLKAVGVI